MGDVSKEKEALKNAYPRSPTWADKVEAMSETQVIAVYSRFKALGKLGK